MVDLEIVLLNDDVGFHSICASELRRGANALAAIALASSVDRFFFRDDTSSQQEHTLVKVNVSLMN
jgi:hypothetical protein